MNESNLDAIQRELALRKVRREGAGLLKGRELHDFLSIREKHNQERSDTERVYRAEYKMRVDVGYQMLLKKAGSLKPVHKPRFFGTDQFNTRRLQQHAERLVRFEHERTMARLDESELKDSRIFLEKCSQRRSYAESFNTSKDRRNQERRKGPDRRHTPTLSD